MAVTGATAADGGVGQDTGLVVEMLIMADLSKGHRAQTCPVFLALYRLASRELEADWRLLFGKHPGTAVPPCGSEHFSKR